MEERRAIGNEGLLLRARDEVCSHCAHEWARCDAREGQSWVTLIAVTSAPRGKGWVCRWLGGRVILLTTPTGRRTPAVKREHASSLRRCVSSRCVFSYIYMLVKSTLESPTTPVHSRYIVATTRSAVRGPSHSIAGCIAGAWASEECSTALFTVVHTRVRNAIVVRRKGQSMVVLPSRQGLDVESSEIVFSGGGSFIYILLPTAVHLGDLHLKYVNPGPSPGNGGQLETSLSLLTRNLAR